MFMAKWNRVKGDFQDNTLLWLFGRDKRSGVKTPEFRNG
jgi:hypothetical protein